MLSRRTLLLALLALVFVAFLALAGCSGKGAQSDAGSQGKTEADSSDATGDAGATEGDELYTPAYKPNGAETMVMTTSQGDITVELYGEDAPVHVANFIELAKKGFYDGTKFHRYEPGFVIQGGDPQTKDATPDEVKTAVASGQSMFGTGGPGYRIKAEYDPKSNPRRHEKGALGMARSQDPDSAGSQFYFALEPLAQLDGQYTVFGKVTKGMDVVEKLRVGDTIDKVEVLGASD